MTLSLVTGGCGFIGRHLVARLLTRGGRVRVLDVAGPGGLPPEADFVLGSAADAVAVDAAMQGVTHLYHLAGIPHFWRRDKADFDLANRLGVEVVLGAAAVHRVARVVHCSTESILLPRHMNGRAEVDESISLGIADMPGPYTRSKFLGEEIALDAARKGLDVVVVNPTVPVGAGDANMTPPAQMLAHFLKGGAPFYLDCALNLADVRDLAEGMVLAAERGRAGERYILGGENVSMRRLLALLEYETGRKMPRIPIPAPVALTAGFVSGLLADHVTGRRPPATLEAVRVAVRYAPFDSSKAERELGYRPRPVEPAILEAVRWLTGKKAA